MTRQQEMFGKVFRDMIIPALQEKGIFLVPPDRCSATQIAFAKTYFAEKVKPHIKVREFRTGEESPFLNNKGLYFIIPLGEGR